MLKIPFGFGSTLIALGVALIALPGHGLLVLSSRVAFQGQHGRLVGRSAEG